MKIAVLGSGVIGITTAYFLARSGHDVTIIDRQSGTAQECSFANASQLSYCNAQPWSNRGSLKKAIQWLGRKDAPLRLNFKADINMWLWMARFVANCTESRENENTKRILELCLYSRDVLLRNHADFDFDFSYSRGGKIFTFENKADMESYRRQCQFQETLGAPYEVLSFDDLLQYEPNMAHLRGTVVGGVRDTLDDTADCHRFCLGLEEKLKKMGVTFMYNTNITAINKNGKTITSVSTDKGDVTADKYILSLGAYSPFLAKSLGIKLPIYPFKGYSITVDIKNPDAAPHNSITYQPERTVFSRIGNRMRVSGTAELTGYDHSITPFRIEMLKKLTRKVFPECGDVEAASTWSCLRPSTPDCRPIIGDSGYDNMVLNTGHGSLGWTMAFASAQLAADIAEGKTPALDMQHYSMKRF